MRVARQAPPSTVWLAALLALAVARPAAADVLDEGIWAVSIERLYGVTATTESTDVAGVESSVSTVNWSLLSNPLASSRTVYSAPRVAVDHLITEAWSAGAAAGVIFGSTSSETGGESQDLGGALGFVLSPRAGYQLSIADAWAFWPKAGFTVTSVTSGSGDAEVGQLRVALSLAAPLLVRVTRGVALSFAGTLDLGISGDNSRGSGSTVDATATEFGLQGGLSILFE